MVLQYACHKISPAEMFEKLPVSMGALPPCQNNWGGGGGGGGGKCPHCPHASAAYDNVIFYYLCARGLLQMCCLMELLSQ